MRKKGFKVSRGSYQAEVQKFRDEKAMLGDQLFLTYSNEDHTAFVNVRAAMQIFIERFLRRQKFSDADLELLVSMDEIVLQLR